MLRLAVILVGFWYSLDNYMMSNAAYTGWMHDCGHPVWSDSCCESHDWPEPNNPFEVQDAETN